MRVGVVVPVLDEAKRIGRQLERLFDDTFDDIVVVDGGSTDDTVAIAEDAGARVVRSAQGRAVQMNAGVDAMDVDVILFLHADVVLPVDAARLVRQGIGHLDWGYFRIKTVPDRPFRFRRLLWMADIRSRVGRLPYGDQCVFVRRSVFEEVGRFDAIELMEDFAFARKMRGRRPARLDATVRVSARRFESAPLYYIAVMNVFPTLYRLGVSPQTLLRLYGAPR